MQTETVKLTKENRQRTLDRAVRIIKSGGLVVFPTETVYGLGANAEDQQAVKKIFIAKGRPSDNPIIVHIATLEQLSKLTDHISSLEQKLIDIFWPGPLTIIFQKNKNVPDVVSGGLDTVAARMPSHPFAHDLILSAGVPIAAPSANLSGRPSGTTGEHIFVDLEGRVNMIINAGSSDIGLESTVVRVNKNNISILRPGAVTHEMLERFAPVSFASDKKELQSSPGTRYRHYAPKAKLEILKSRDALGKRLKDLREKNMKVGVLPKRNLKKASKNLYHDLRALDAQGVEIILCESFPEKGLGVALMDRLKRAAKK